MADRQPPASQSEKKEKSFAEFETSANELLERSRQLLEAAAAYSSKLKAEGDAIGSQATALGKDIKALQTEVSKAADRDEISIDEAEKLEDEIKRARSAVYDGDVTALMPHKANGTFMGMLLGNVNVVAARREVRFKVKEEYNTYRDRTALVFLTFPSVLLFLKHYYAGQCLPGLLVTAYSAWLLFFYTSLALRENILKINGSDIRPWWIQHHYFAMLMALVSLTWGVEGSDCLQKQESVSLFLLWAVMQGVVMLLQNRYQRRRMYTRIALGKAGRMDVVWGESAGVKGQLWVLYPLLFALQGFQFYIGSRLIMSSIFVSYEWQIVACGVLLIIMAVGNFLNTVATLATKAKIKNKMNRKRKEMTETIARTFSGPPKKIL